MSESQRDWGLVLTARLGQRMPEASVLGAGPDPTLGAETAASSQQTPESTPEDGLRAGRKGLWFKGNDLMMEKSYVTPCACVCMWVHGPRQYLQ